MDGIEEMNRRLRMLAVGVATVLAAPVAVAVPGQAATEASGGPVVFGARAGKTVAMVQSYEARVNHPVSDVRLYYLWNSTFPNATATWARDNGRQVFMSVNAKRKDGTAVPWSSIATAQPGSPLYAQMQTWATAIKNFGAPVYFTFNHEPEAQSSRARGNAAGYQAAWQQFITVLRANGVTNAEYVFIGTAFGYGKGKAQPYYPGDAYVDAIGVDAYNWYTCRSGIANEWFSMQNLVDRMMPFADMHPTKPLMLPEFGTTEDPANPARKAEWYTDAKELFKTPPYDRFTLVNEFDTLRACEFRPDSSAESLVGFETWLNDPYYSG